jgi:hypothetical protein
MARNSEQKVTEARDEFDNEQLTAVETLYHANAEEVDFQIAADIGLVSAETFEQIQRVFADHQVYFERVLETQTKTMPPFEAYKKAFEMVYGRFLFEQRLDGEGEIEHKDGMFMEKMGTVLKFKVDGSGSIEGRSELQSASRRLNAIDAIKPAEGVSEAMLAAKQAEHQALSDESDEILAKRNELVGHSESAETLFADADLESNLAELRSAGEFVEHATGEIATLLSSDTPLSRDEESARTASLEALNTDIDSIVNGQSLFVTFDKLQRSDKDISAARQHIEDLREKELAKLVALRDSTDKAHTDAIEAASDSVSKLGEMRALMVASEFSADEISLVEGVFDHLILCTSNFDAFASSFEGETVGRIRSLLSSDVLAHFDTVFGSGLGNDVRQDLEKLLVDPKIFAENQEKMAKIVSDIDYNTEKADHWRKALTSAQANNVNLMSQIYGDLNDQTNLIAAWDLTVLETMFPGLTPVVSEFLAEYQAQGDGLDDRDQIMNFINNNYSVFIRRLTEVLSDKAASDIESGLDQDQSTYDRAHSKWEEFSNGAASPAASFSANKGFLASMMDKLSVHRSEVKAYDDGRAESEQDATDSYAAIRKGQGDVADALRGLNLDHLEALSGGFRQIVVDYLSAYDSASFTDDPTVENQRLIGEFIENTFVPFAAALRSNLTAAVDGENAELMRVAALIATTLGDLSRLSEGAGSKVLAKMDEDIKRQLKEIADDRTELEAKKVRLDADHTAATSSLATARGELTELNRKRGVEVAKKEALDVKIAEKQAEIEGLEGEIKALEDQIDGARDNIADIVEAAGHLDVADDRKPSIESALVAYTKSETERQKEADDLEAEIAEMERALEGLEDSHIIKALSSNGVDFPSLTALKAKLKDDSLNEDQIAELEEEIEKCDSDGQRIVWSRILLRIPATGVSSLLKIKDPGDKLSRSIGSFASKYSNHKYTAKPGDRDTAHARAGKHMVLGGKALATLKGAIEHDDFLKVKDLRAKLAEKRAKLEAVNERKVDVKVLLGDMQIFADSIAAVPTHLPLIEGNDLIVEVGESCGKFTNAYEAISLRIEAGDVSIDELNAFMDEYIRSGFSADIRGKLETLQAEEEARKEGLVQTLTEKKSDLEKAGLEHGTLQESADKIAARIAELDGQIEAKTGEVDELVQKIADLDRELAEITKDLDALTERVAEINSMKASDWILSKSFGEFDPVAYRRAGRGVVERKEESKAAKDAEDYFKTDQLRNLTAQYAEYEVDAAAYSGAPLSEQITGLNASLTILRDSLKKKSDPDRAKKELDFENHSKTLEKLKSLRSRSEKILKSMQTLSAHIEVLIKLEIYEFPGGSLAAASNLKAKLAVIDLTKPSFKCEDLIALSNELRTYFSQIDPATLTVAFDNSDARIKEAIEDAEREVKDMDVQKAANRDLSDSAAGKKVHMALIEEQFGSELSLEQKNKLAALVMADDVDLMQVDKDYRELAGMGRADLYDTVQDMAFKNKLIDFRFKDGDKTVQPFKGLKPEQFNDWESVEKLFDLGKLNLKNGFFYLAAMEGFEAGVRSIQSYKAEKKVKELLAKGLGVDERMDEAGINKIVNEAFEMHMEAARPMMTNFFELDNEKRSEWSEFKIYELNRRFKLLNERRKLNEVDSLAYETKLQSLLDEAEDFGLQSMVDFSSASMMFAWWNSPAAQKVRDIGASIGNYTLGKSGRVLAAGGVLAAKGVWGGVKTGAGLTVQSALFPLRATKYPLILAAKPIVGFVNLFRKEKWVPLPRIRDSFRTDVGRVTGYFKGEADKRWEGTKNSFTTVPGEQWKKTQYEYKDWKDRTNIDKDQLKKDAEEYAEKSEPEAIEATGNGVVDLEQFKKRIAQLDKINNSAPPEVAAAA